MLRCEKGARLAYRQYRLQPLEKINCCAKFSAAAVGSRVLGESFPQSKNRRYPRCQRLTH